jgi:hypothetical protein
MHAHNRPSRRSSKYEALSYVWGSQENPKTIHLNGQAFFITQNLHRALIRLRKPAEDRLIWIDALAINQSDISERNVQVRKMLIIYKSAGAVLAWIGQGNEDLGEPTDTWGSAGLSLGFKIPDWDCIFESVLDRNDVQQLFSLKWLGQYEYWSRAWIIQEITHSNANFILGPYEATYRDLFRIWWRVMAQQFSIYDAEAGENPADSAVATGSRLSAIMLTSTSKLGPDGTLDLVSWLESFILMHEPRCLVPHGMIYAFYGLFIPEVQSKISIDYTMPIADLFTLMTRIYVETTGNLWLLSFVEVSSRCCTATPTLDAGLPTWAFNFAGKISAFSQWHKPICAKGIKDGKTSIFYHRSEASDKSLLHVKGVCIGQVQQVDRSSRHKFFLGISFALSKCSLGVTSDEEAAFISAFLRPFAELEDFSNLLVHNFDLLNALERKYWAKSCAALHSHFDRLMFSYIPKHSRDHSDERGSHRQFALGNPGVLTGDKLCLILGCPLPLLLRQAGSSYTVVGSAYAQGYMEGEAMDALGIDMDDLQAFCLC